MVAAIFGSVVQIHYDYIGEATLFAGRSVVLDRQLQNFIWLMASGPFNNQFEMPEADFALTGLNGASADLLSLRTASHESNAIIVDATAIAAGMMKFGPAPLRLLMFAPRMILVPMLRPVTLPSPFQWRMFYESLTGMLIAEDLPEDLDRFLDVCFDWIEDLAVCIADLHRDADMVRLSLQ